MKVKLHGCLHSFPLWGKAGMGARPMRNRRVAQAPTPALPQRGRGQYRPRHAQRGAALLIALLTVTLVATFAATALWQQWRSTEIEAAERARLQSAWVLVGALDWARLALREDARAGGADHLGEPWAVPLAEARLSSFLAADRNVASDELAGLPDAFLSGHIVDAQGKLNVFNLIAGGQPVPTAVAAFQKLFGMLGLPPEQVMLMVNGLRLAMPVAASATPGTGDAPAQQAAPADSANRPLLPQRVQELVWFGLPASTVAAIEPYVTLLPPVATSAGPGRATTLNLNTASAEVLAASLPELDLAGAQRVVAHRERSHFRTVDEANELLPQENDKFSPGQFGVATRYFEAFGLLRLDRLWVQEHSLIHRDSQKLTVLWRERGAGATPGARNP